MVKPRAGPVWRS